jgi:hypothetical protein
MRQGRLFFDSRERLVNQGCVDMIRNVELLFDEAHFVQGVRVFL